MGPSTGVRIVVLAVCAALVGGALGCNSSDATQWSLPTDDASAGTPDTATQEPVDGTTSVDVVVPPPNPPDAGVDAPAPADAPAEAWTPDGRHSGNPIIQSIFTADPTARVWDDGRIYLYPSHDIDPPQGCNLMDKYHVYSSSNMVDWIDEGQILQASDVSWGRPEGGFMWAPDIAHVNGTYYYYFPHPSGAGDLWGSTWKIGVATSTSPATGFTSQSYIPGLDSLIDPAVFVDDDGQAYLYIGGGGTSEGGKLKPSMVEMQAPMQPMQGLMDFHEATWVHKRNGIYYLSYADNTGPHNQMRYATSSNPLGPWTYRGLILNPTNDAVTHGSIVEYKGQSYLFYLTADVSQFDWLRSVNVDLLNYNPDGTIQLVTPTTEGVPSVGPPEVRPVIGTYEAEDGQVSMAQVVTDPAASGGKAVGGFGTAGAQVQFASVDAGTGGRTTLHVYFATSAATSSTHWPKLHLTVNGTDYSFINTPPTGSFSTYTGHAFLTVPMTAGKTNTITLANGDEDLNVDYITTTGF
jgi:hypothetical protein